MAKEYAKKFYHSKAWKDCRKSYISSVHGICERCYDKGKITPGYIVHHIIYITPQNINNPEITLNHENLLYVCHSCHEIIHKGEKSAIREGLTINDYGEVVEID